MEMWDQVPVARSTTAGFTVEADAPVCADCDESLVSRHGCLGEPLYRPQSLV
jgi:fructoselysine-6-P-deglycase FrlB-like protein